MASHLGVSSDAVGSRSCRKLSSRSSHGSTTSPCSPVNMAKAHEIGTSSIKKRLLLVISTRFS